MPTYEWACDCGETVETVSTVATRNDNVPQCHGAMHRVITVSYAVPDLPGYTAVAGDMAGKEIRGRSAHREYLKRNGLIEVGTEKMVNGKPDFRPAKGAVREELSQVVPKVLQRYRNG